MGNSVMLLLSYILVYVFSCLCCLRHLLQSLLLWYLSVCLTCLLHVCVCVCVFIGQFVFVCQLLTIYVCNECSEQTCRLCFSQLSLCLSD